MRAPLVAILAGGKSSRMGRDKAMIVVGGMTMLERMVRVGLKISAAVFVFGREGPPEGWPANLLPEWVGDRDAGQGMMATLVDFLERADWPVVLLACDTPLLREETVRALVGWHEEGALATVAVGRDEGGVEYVEPTLGVYEPGVVGVLRRLMVEDGGSFQGLLGEAEVQRWVLTEGRAREMLNVNSEEDVLVAEGFLQGRGHIGPRP